MKSAIGLTCSIVIASLALASGCSADENHAGVTVSDGVSSRNLEGDAVSPAYAKGSRLLFSIVKRDEHDRELDGWSLRSESPAVVRVSTQTVDERGGFDVELEALAEGEADIAIVDERGDVNRALRLTVAVGKPRLRVDRYFDEESMLDGELRIVKPSATLVRAEHVDATGRVLAGARFESAAWDDGGKAFAIESFLVIDAARDSGVVTAQLLGGEQLAVAVASVEPTEVAEVRLDKSAETTAIEGDRVCANLILRDAARRRLFGGTPQWSVSTESGGDQVCYRFSLKVQPFAVTVKLGDHSTSTLLHGVPR